MNHRVAESSQTESGRASVVPFPVHRRAASSLSPDRRRESYAAKTPVVTLWGLCPWNDELSDYDRRNIDLYARLLHDESEGASEEDLARDAFAIDPYRHRDRALAILRSHLRRAHWIADTLFPMLDW